MISPPRFWSAKEGRHHPLALLLSPLGGIYGAAVARKLAKSVPEKAPIPVICAGNITMGGVGKTPFVAELASRLSAMGHTPFILTRGYGGSLTGPVRAAPEHTAAEIGDEARMLSCDHPVIVSRDRVEGAKLAHDEGASAIVMDDGFQNPGLHKDVTFLLVDGETGLGNGRIFPAGPLREAPHAALTRAAALVIVGGREEHQPPHLPESALPVMRMRLESVVPLERLGQPAHAFSGIGRPEKFFKGLETAGVELLERTSFPDHHMFTEEEIARLIARAAADDAQLLTTEKDFARLSPDQADGITPIPARLTLDNPALLDQFLASLPEPVR
ncbi:tetraacyldisaccharide 4'-kinase [Parvularcula marina]|uniref:Tetraacyldisaccharide 4'-kinase n=1 Tax=Parvularcula marina TaxID=2292771 RepID=A0A371REJ5_9PROT|nr:tetraacyldisaccharide 4'-kinase [Parvularcula marina]RFB03864.1 tetraacyldisaccharide 4'-kinase [Parvularcula marina]